MKKVYFLSDAHLGAKVIEDHKAHEKRLVRFLNSIQQDAKAIYLLGDIIDYWYEYKEVVPRGYTRFFGKIAELTDAGIEVHWFTGNHDIWIFDYLPQELGVTVHRGPLLTTINNKKFFLAHGDGLGDDSLGIRIMNWCFHNPILQKLYAAIHPRWTVSFAKSWSKNSRLKGDEFPFLGEEKERLVVYTKQLMQNSPVDFYIYGHRHIMLDLMLSRESRIVILGDWVNYFSYAVLDGENLWLEQFEEEEAQRQSGQDQISIAF